MKKRFGLRPGWDAADLVFFAVLGLALFRFGSELLDDADTFWHVRVGQDMWEAGKIVNTDELSYSRNGVTWREWSWLSDLVMAGVVNWRGWSGLIGLSALILAWTYWGLARYLTREGFWSIVVLVAALVTVRVGMIHWLARPHLVTFLGFVWMMQAARSYHLGIDRQLYWAPLVMIFWVNCHGGFLAGDLALFLGFCGHLIAGPWDNAWKRRSLGFMVIGILTGLVSIINPYGWKLYGELLGVVDAWDLPDITLEFRPMQLSATGVSAGEWLILFILALPTFSRTPIRRYDLPLAVAWVHLGLSTQRYIPFMAMALAPALAQLLQGLFPKPDASSKSEVETPVDAPKTPDGVLALPTWPIAGTVGVVIALAFGVSFGGPSATRYPMNALEIVNAQSVDEPIFHELTWGGLILGNCEPKRPVYIDTRTPVYGRAMTLEFFQAQEGKDPAWTRIVNQYDIRLVWLRPERGLVKRLRQDPDWTILLEDDQSVLLRKIPKPAKDQPK